MKNENARNQLKRMMADPSIKADDYNALKEAVRALDLIGHLIDRPCEACEYHGDSGCSEWVCVFDGKCEQDFDSWWEKLDDIEREEYIRTESEEV